MSDLALTRLKSEYRLLTLNRPEEIIMAGPVDEENFFEWKALITVLKGTYFVGGVFPLKLFFPPDYPSSPPRVTFDCPMFHPNVYPEGGVCIPILYRFGFYPMGPAAECWKPGFTIEKVLLSVVSMLAEPNDQATANLEAATDWREERVSFDLLADCVVTYSIWSTSCLFSICLTTFTLCWILCFYVL